MPSAHSNCWENSAPGLSARRGLPFAHGSLAAPQDKRASLTPEPITLPTDLPVLYRAHISNLVETLTDGDVAGLAGDELQELLESVVVSWDADLGAHQLEIRGKLLEMLQKAKPADAAGLVSCESSLNLVAGGRSDLDRTSGHFRRQKLHPHYKRF